MIRSVAVGIVAGLLVAIASRFMDGLLNELMVAIVIGAVVGIGGVFAFKGPKSPGEADV